jgi:hypothetical protein
MTNVNLSETVCPGHILCLNVYSSGVYRIVFWSTQTQRCHFEHKAQSATDIKKLVRATMPMFSDEYLDSLFVDLALKMLHSD